MFFSKSRQLNIIKKVMSYEFQVTRSKGLPGLDWRSWQIRLV